MILSYPTFYFIKNSGSRFNHISIKIGDTLPVGAKELQKISKYKFYIVLVEKAHWLSRGDWIPDDKPIQKMGGLIEIYDPSRAVVGKALYKVFGLKTDRYSKFFSVVIVTNTEAQIVGIYKNQKPSQLLSIFQLHPDLIDLHLAGTAL